MRLRRGSAYYTSERSTIIYSFREDDIVKPFIASSKGDSSFYGIVRRIDPKENKVYVAWGGGPVTQHDPEEILLALDIEDEIRKELQERLTVGTEDTYGYRNRRMAGRGRKFLAVTEEKEDATTDEYVGDPETHGMDEPRGGGFSIMQDLVDDLHEESYEESGVIGGKKMDKVKVAKALLAIAKDLFVARETGSLFTTLKSRRNAGGTRKPADYQWGKEE